MTGLILHLSPAVLAVAAAAVTAIATTLLFIGVGQLIERQESVREQIEALSPMTGVGGTSESERRTGTVQQLLRILNRILSGRSFSAAVATELARANLPLTVTEYVLITAACGISLFALALLLLRQMLFAMVIGLLGLFLPRIYIRRLQAKRLIAFQEQLPDILAMLVGALRSGYGVTAAMDMVAQQMPPPASEEFGRVVRDVGLGASSGQALANMVRRIHSDDLDLVVTAMGIQYEVGGNLSTILETISGAIRERIRLKGQLRVLTSQAYLQRTILTALPVVLGAIIFVLNPVYLGALLVPPWVLIPISAGVFVILGWVVMGKLSEIEF